MAALQEIESINQINEQDLSNVTKIVLESLMIKRNSKKHSLATKQEEFINIFSSFLEKYLDLEMVSSRQNKIYLINFIDKLNMQKELLELLKGETNVSDIKIAAQRLGRKSQSAFKTK